MNMNPEAVIANLSLMNQNMVLARMMVLQSAYYRASIEEQQLLADEHVSTENWRATRFFMDQVMEEMVELSKNLKEQTETDMARIREITGIQD